MPATTSRTTSSRSAEDGVGVVGELVGVTAFLVLLFFAVHLVLNLYATSLVTAAAFDAARIVAGADGGPGAEAEAERRARGLLDGYEDDGALAFSWSYPSTDGDAAPDVVELRVVASHPTRLLPRLAVPFSRVERTITLRLERER